MKKIIMVIVMVLLLVGCSKPYGANERHITTASVYNDKYELIQTYEIKNYMIGSGGIYFTTTDGKTVFPRTGIVEINNR